VELVLGRVERMWGEWVDSILGWDMILNGFKILIRDPQND